jgi:hypothetical protein
MTAVIGATEGVHRREEGQRRHRHGENREQRDFVRMGYKHADGTAVDRATEGPHEIPAEWEPPRRAR